MRVDDYKNACLIAAKELADQDMPALATAAGAEWLPDKSALKMNFMGRSLLITAPEMGIKWVDQKEGEEFSLTDAVLVLHYLQGAQGSQPTGEWVAYRQIPGGEFYAKAFNGRAEAPLAKVFGQTKGLLARSVEAMGGQLVSGFGDEAGRFKVLPNIDLLVQVYLGDEEFESSGQVLFDKAAGAYFSNEDLSWLGSALVYRLMGIARGLA